MLIKPKYLFLERGEGYHKTVTRWLYNGHEIGIVSSFNYLGVVFSSGGSFMKATSTLAGKALRSLYSLKSILREVQQVPVNILFNLFDAYVLSVLNNNSEVWGFNNADSIERVQKKFCKSVLNVKIRLILWQFTVS